MLKEFISDNCKKNINFDFILDQIKPITKYGQICKKNSKPFRYGQEQELQIEFDKLEAFLNTDKRRETIDILKEIRYINETLHRAKSAVVLDEVELFEVKKLLIYIEKLEKILKSTHIHKYHDLNVQAITRLSSLLDPGNQRVMSFYLYAEYSDELKKIRDEIKTVEVKIGKIKKELIKSIEQKYEIKLNTREEVTINKNLESKIIELNQEAMLRISGENYLSLIYKLKNNQELDELETELEKLKLRENEEEFKIRKSLTEQIAKAYDEIIENTEKIARLDYLIAKANCAQKLMLVRPEINKELLIDIKNGRNLKLEDTLKQKRKEYTSISLKLNKKLICITGANMGGKTVSLRMIGQIAATAAYGMFVPCESARICLFEHIHISVGDEQSIEKGLSTFGAEIVNLKEALEDADKRSLILIDELAGGTNPKEGFAITKAVVEYLKSSNSMAILTTHYDNIAQDDDIQNFQVKGLKLPEHFTSFSSIEEISKYMDYSLIEVKEQNFVPKDAISIAKMAGIPQEIIQRATELIN